MLPVTITLLRAGSYHPDDDLSAADDPGATLETSTMGWQPFTSGAVDVKLVPGNHVMMLSTENASVPAASIAKRLSAASRAPDAEAAPHPASAHRPEAFVAV